jgi:hypothetical protein
MGATRPGWFIGELKAQMGCCRTGFSNGPPLGASDPTLNLTVLKQRRESFIWQQGWPEQSAAEALGRGPDDA